MTAPALASWHRDARLWSASVELFDGAEVAWGFGSAPTREEAVELARAHACALLHLGKASPYRSFRWWVAHAVTRGILARKHVKDLLARPAEILPMLAWLEGVFASTRPELMALRLEGVHLRARLRAELRARTTNAPEARTP
jgi:hypothetical protein